MINPENSLIKNAINMGALTGLVMGVLQLLFLILGFGEDSGFQWLIYIALILSISWSTRAFRDRANNGYMSYGESLGMGVLISIGSAVVYGFLFYIYMKFLNPEFINELLDKTELGMYESGLQDQQIEQIMELYRTFFGPGLFSLSMVFSFSFMGLIISLIISFFTRRNKPLFEE